jgi:RNA polymerase sigma-70 factor (ECF subfamily)
MRPCACAGRAAIRAFFATSWQTCGGLRLRQTTANGQPAFAVYQRGVGGEVWAAHSIHVLSLEGDEIAGATLFVDLDPQPLFQALGLPLVLAAA